METCTQPPPSIDLATDLYFQLVYTLTSLLPPPLDDTPEALRARNHAAIAKVAALLPVNANEADLAAQASPLGPRPRKCCGCSVRTPMTSAW
jgi:hypothetical protein